MSKQIQKDLKAHQALRQLSSQKLEQHWCNKIKPSYINTTLTVSRRLGLAIVSLPVQFALIYQYPMGLEFLVVIVDIPMH
jgi:hypothetical protein